MTVYQLIEEQSREIIFLYYITNDVVLSAKPRSDNIFLPFYFLYHRWVLAHKGTQVGKQMVLKDIRATVDITRLHMFAASQFFSSPLFFIPYPPDYWNHHLHLLVDGYMGSVIQRINHKGGREYTTECRIWQNAKIDKRFLFSS